MNRGKLIVLEGGDAVGKSAHASRLASELNAVQTHEPGGDPFSDVVRTLFLDSDIIRQNPLSDVFLLASMRAEKRKTVLEPTLNAGRHVIADRSWISSAVYQVIQGVDVETVKAVNQLALGEYFEPDLIIILDADPAKSLARLSEPRDSYEKLGIEFHNKVRSHYLNIAHELNAVVINAEQSLETVYSAIREAVQQRLNV